VSEVFAVPYFRSRTDCCIPSYYLCEKTDGIRCLLYCTEDEQGGSIAYLIDRKNEFYFLQDFHLPKPGDETTSHNSLIIDGELVIDKVSDGTTRLRFLVFDFLFHNRVLFTQKPFDKRLGALHQFVIQPYKELFKKYPEELARQPFEVQSKQMEKPYGIEMMFRDRIPNLPHVSDGLIFTCKDSFYVHGTDEQILKWKPPHENTVDFRLQLGDFPAASESDSSDEYDYEAKPTFELLVNFGRGDYRVFANLYITDQEWDDMKALNEELDGRIIECYQDTQGRWRYKKEASGSPRFRDDKNDGNFVDVVRKVLESIEDGVSEEDLIAATATIQRAWKERHPEEQKRKA
jgi:mRNA guanylyltransferase